MLMCEPFSGSSHAVKLRGRAQLASFPAIDRKRPRQLPRRFFWNAEPAFLPAHKQYDTEPPPTLDQKGKQ